MAAEPGAVVILNGAPRAGKTSICRALQDGGRPWLNLGVDTMMAATPAAWLPGVGLRPGGERPDLEPVVARLYSALFDSLAAHSRQGLDVVADLGVHEGYSRSLGVWVDGLQRLARLPVLVVGVRCSIEQIMVRRNSEPADSGYLAGETVPPPVQRWQDEVHRPGIYDLEVDTSVLSPTQCADAVTAALTSRAGPSALDRLLASID